MIIVQVWIDKTERNRTRNIDQYTTIEPTIQNTQPQIPTTSKPATVSAKSIPKPTSNPTAHSSNVDHNNNNMN